MDYPLCEIAGYVDNTSFSDIMRLLIFQVSIEVLVAPLLPRPDGWP